MADVSQFYKGGFRASNILVKPGSDLDIQKLYIIDWENAQAGAAGLELSPFCAEMYLMMRLGSRVTNEDASTLLSNFLDAYAQVSKPSGHHLARDALAGCGSQIVTSAPHAPSADKETARSLVTEGIQFLVGSRKEDFVAQSIVKELLPN